MILSLTTLSPLGRWYAILATLASLAAVQASLFPRWPRAAPLSEESIVRSLRQSGLAPKSVKLTDPISQPKRSQELSVSAPLVFRFPGGEELRLVRGTFRQRYSLQAAGIAAMSPGLALEGRQLLVHKPPSAQGRLQGHPARQTCFVPHALQPAAYGVTWEQLLPLADSPTLGRKAKLRRLIGTQANYNYGCVLVSLRSAQDRPVPEDLWLTILTALPSGLGERRGDAAAKSTNS